MKRKKLLTSIIAALATLTVGVFGTILVASAMETPPSVAEIPATACIGEQFDIPEYFHEVNGERVKADVRVVAPNGTVYSREKLNIEQIGKYTVQYLVKGQVVSTVSCVALRRSTEMFSVNKYAQIQGIETYPYAQGETFSGVQAKVGVGAEITFERELDMTARKKDEVLLQMLVSPSKQGERDFGQLILTFTDVENEDVTMTVVASDGNLDSVSGSAHSYVRASGDGQTSYGREYKGGQWTYSSTSIYGSPAPFSFEGTQGVITDYALNLCYDSEENALYLKNGANHFYGEPYLVVDFDDVALYGTNVWNGFPSGKAKLSVNFDRFVNESGYVIFSEIDGIDLAQEKIVDNEAPSISIDLKGEEKAPNSYKGATYSIFSATAKDFFDTDCRLTTEVKYNDLLGEEWYDVPVKNGVFITDKVGKYEIRYFAEDLSGNVSDTSLSFYCFNRAEEIAISVKDEEITANVFETVALTSIEEVRAFGGNGKLDIALTVLAPDSAEVDVVNNCFTPEQIGRYTIKYVATDYFGMTGTKECSLLVSGVAEPIFTKEIILPEVLIAGFEYNLPTAIAKLCENDEVKDANVKVFLDNEEIDYKFTVPGGKDSIVIEYRAYAADGTTYVPFTKTIPVVDGQKGKAQAAYFYNADGNVTATQEKNAIKLSVEDNGSVFFANELNRNSFLLNVSYQAGKANFSAMTAVLSDSLDGNKKVSFKISFTPLGLNVTVPGGNTAGFAMRMDTEASYFTLSYDNKLRSVSDIEGNSLFTVSKDDNGNAFAGFTNGVYMTLKFDGVKTDSEISLTTLNNQALGYKNSESEPIGDTVAPQVVINGEFKKRCQQGETITVFTADAFDVLGQVESLTLSVYAPDNTCLLNRVSTDKDYTVKLDKTGRYRIIYEAMDCYGNSKGGSSGTNVISLDAVAPTLTVNGTLKTTYKVGDTISLPTYTVNDDSSKVNVDIFLELPNSEVRLLVSFMDGKTVSYLSAQNGAYPNSFKVDENTFRLETAGKYKLTYFAYDNTYNYVMQTIEFTVVN